MNKNVLLVLILFILLLCSFPTSAFIPGDFDGSGRVDFEDLMLFALAYGSTTTDANWNPVCDLDPDGKIDFEDLMIFAIHYGEEKPPVHNMTQDIYYHIIQEAINASDSGDSIEVYPGTYYENIQFDNRNITLRSADPSDPAIVATTVIDGGNIDSVVKFSGGDTSTLQGFKITNGNGSSGGGIFVNYSSPVITANMITDNTGHSGGGIFMYDSAPIITGNTITDNNAIGGGGGGISMNSYSSPIIQDNMIKENRSTYYGGGIYVSPSSNISPVTDRPVGWGTDRKNIPTGISLVPAEGVEYIIAGNTFLGNQHGDPLDYTEGAHVYFN